MGVPHLQCIHVSGPQTNRIQASDKISVKRTPENIQMSQMFTSTVPLFARIWFLISKLVFVASYPLRISSFSPFQKTIETPDLI